MNQTEQALTINDYLEGRVPLSALVKFAVMAVISQKNVAYNVETNSCEYLAPNGTKCIVGWVLPEPVLDSLSGSKADTVLEKQFGIKLNSKLSYVLTVLQGSHDYHTSRLALGRITRQEFSENLSYDAQELISTRPDLFNPNSPFYQTDP